MENIKSVENLKNGKLKHGKIKTHGNMDTWKIEQWKNVFS